MISLLKQVQRIGNSLITGTLLCTIAISSLSPIFYPQPVQAQLVVQDPINLVQNTLSAGFEGASAAGTAALQFKELIADGLGYVLINLVIEQLIRDVTMWVASGFDGKPAFVENLKGMLGDLADNVVGDYIWNSDALGYLCSPFAFDVKLALDLQYGSERDYRKSQCTLTGIGDNLDSFMSQGWDNWFDVTMNSSNNPYGAYMEAQAGLTAQLSSARGTEIKQLEFGSGFLSKEECEDVPQGPNDVGPPDRVCKTITPGQTIQTQLGSALGIPHERLAFADEINELIGALLTQLARGVLSEVGGGLSGLGRSQGNAVFGNPAYPSAGVQQGGDEQMLRIFRTDREREERYRTLNSNALETLNTALATPGARCNATLRTELTTRRTQAQTDRDNATRNINTINSYETQVRNSVSATSTQQLLQTYMSTVQPTLHDARDVAELEAAMAVPQTNDAEALRLMADAGNVNALARLYVRSCTTP